MLLYVRDDISFNVLNNTDFGIEIEAVFVEITIRKFKWLICCSFNPRKADIEPHLKALDNHLDLQSSKYETFIIMGDFNGEPSEMAWIYTI